jgi:hypothetical protein
MRHKPTNGRGVGNVIDLAAEREVRRPIDALAILKSANDAELDALSDSVWEDIRLAAVASGDELNLARYLCAKSRKQLPARFRVNAEDDPVTRFSAALAELDALLPRPRQQEVKPSDGAA